MKLRSITLDNVRRFTEPVTVGPFGDGVTLLCEPNEAGKSTLFDALHALFFVKHGSQAKEIKALRPHSGGSVAVECELDHEGAIWRVRKQWLSSAEARVWQDKSLMHQGDAAEDWLSGLVAGEAGGPGGLLWVRQGRVSLSIDGSYGGADRKGDEFERRRDLLTAISGAMDAVTGGERMDRALDKVRSDLNPLEIDSGKSRKGGRWQLAEAQVTKLEDHEVELQAIVEGLRSDLEQRRRLADDLAGLQDAEGAAQRRDAVTQAEAALREAESRASKVAAAETRAKLARQTFESARDEQTRISDLRKSAELAAEAHELAAGEKSAAEKKAKVADDALRAARQALAEVRRDKAEAEAVLRRIISRDAAARARKDREALEKRVGEAEKAETERLAFKAEAKNGPDASTLQTIERLTRDFDTQRGIRDAAAPRISAIYEPGARQVVVAGTRLAAGETRVLPDDGRIVVPGIGDLHISGSDQDVDLALDEAERKLSEALAEGGWPDLDALHAAARARIDAEGAMERSADRRDVFAPNGLDALKEELADLSEAEDDDADDDLPERAAADVILQKADTGCDRATVAEEKARGLAQGAALALAVAETKETSTRKLFENTAAAIENFPPADAESENQKLIELERAKRQTEAEHSKIATDAPDLEALGAKLKRVASVAEQAKEDARRISGELGKIEGRIEVHAEEGVEETLEEVRGNLAAARDRLDRITFEVEVLRRLRDALEAAQKDARETYFEPVAKELRPLLADLWDDAELIWSDDTLLPDALVRKGTEEPIDVLSGGTQEQIAFLVRLAFARLLAKSGRHAPLILDDALVYSDDDRIEKMFDALHGAAGDLQIIVLSCRQRAFRELGAPSLTFERVVAD